MAFKNNGNELNRIEHETFDTERELQELLEENLEQALGITFLDSEYSTGERHGGRIDTIGIDESNTPVILEYKKGKGSNIINQGLFYLNWLVDHQGDFQILVDQKLDNSDDIEIDWSAPRVLCIAESFDKYDVHAVEEIGRPIELIRYRQCGDVLLLDPVASGETSSYESTEEDEAEDTPEYTIDDHYANGTEETVDWFKELREAVLELGDDVTESPRKFYVAYRTLRNFLTVQVQRGDLRCFYSLNPDEQEYQNGPYRDVSDVGHYGTGDLEIRVDSNETLELAIQTAEEAYRNV